MTPQSIGHELELDRRRIRKINGARERLPDFRSNRGELDYSGSRKSRGDDWELQMSGDESEILASFAPIVTAVANECFFCFAKVTGKARPLSRRDEELVYRSVR